MARSVRLSLATKCQLGFGVAVVLILTAALSVVWYRLSVLVREGQEETARTLAAGWMTGQIDPPDRWWIESDSASAGSDDPQIFMRVDKDEFTVASQRSNFIADAIERFSTRGDMSEYGRPGEDALGRPVFLFARAIRKADLYRVRGGTGAGLQPTVDAPALVNPLQMVLVIQLRSDLNERQLNLNRLFIVAAGLFAGLLAIAVFWFITTRIILSPVRVLRDTAEKISEGDLNIRSEIHTGDEFEQLSEMFNHMLTTLKKSTDQLRVANKSLDLKLGELAETNVALYEANKIKGEFLANVSHELRTPLNSIIGFAEILEETLKDRTGPVDEKRKRYAANIITSSRRLLDLINDLLDLAKIEAGRIDVHVAPMSVADTCEGLVSLIRPQAEKRKIEVRMKVEPNLPVVHTDAGKFQQILFNFLSNAAKFTPEGGAITLSASLVRNANALPPASHVIPAPRATFGLSAPASPAIRAAEGVPALMVSVADNGPGIPIDQHERVFEKFTQLDSTVTREHGGTGLGLPISRELAQLLQGQILLESDTDKGATFSLIIPLALESRTLPLMPATPAAPTAFANTGAGA